MKLDLSKLITRWITSNPQTVWKNNRWKRFQGETLVDVDNDVIKRELLKVLKDAQKEDYFRITAQLLSKLYSLAKKHALEK